MVPTLAVPQSEPSPGLTLTPPSRIFLALLDQSAPIPLPLVSCPFLSQSHPALILPSDYSHLSDSGALSGVFSLPVSSWLPGTRFALHGHPGYLEKSTATRATSLHPSSRDANNDDARTVPPATRQSPSTPLTRTPPVDDPSQSTCEVHPRSEVDSLPSPFHDSVSLSILRHDSYISPPAERARDDATPPLPTHKTPLHVPKTLGRDTHTLHHKTHVFILRGIRSPWIWKA